MKGLKKCSNLSMSYGTILLQAFLQKDSTFSQSISTDFCVDDKVCFSYRTWVSQTYSSVVFGALFFFLYGKIFVLGLSASLLNF